MVTARDILILLALLQHFILTRKQVQYLAFSRDDDGRSARRRLTTLGKDGFIKRRTLQVVSEDDCSVAPVYHLTAKGRSLLASHRDDPAVLLAPVEPKQPHSLFHYVAMSDVGILFHEAIAGETEASMPSWHHEDHIINVDEPEKSRHFDLETAVLTPQRKIVCDPDAGFELQYKDSRAVFYVEFDRDRHQWQGRVASKKSPGYAWMHANQGHRKHFPETTLSYAFVLFLTPTAKRRDQLREAFAYQNKEKAYTHGRFFRFAAFSDLKDAVSSGRSLFFDPLFYKADETESVSLIRR